jgi:type II secretory pathway component GspD/PulD (secretin)
VIVSKEDQVRTQLAKTITVRYGGVDVTQVLAELSHRSGVPFTIEPGAVQSIPPEFRTVRLIFDNTSIQQALDNLAGFTGLGYVVNEKGVYIWNQSASPTGPAARDPVIALIPVDGGLQAVLTQSQVPPDVREYLKSRTQREIEKLRQQMKKEGFKPAQPTTSPATKPSEDL